MGSMQAGPLPPGRSPARSSALVALAAGTLVAAAAIEGCSTQPSEQVASAERCMASCNKAAAGGEVCLTWAALTPDSCLRRYSVAQACCGPGDQPECTLTTVLAVGAPCVCRGGDQRGTFVVQGSACKVP